MAQFDIYRNPNQKSRKRVPYLLDVQNDLLGTLGTRIVIPLINATRFDEPISRLNPVFEIDKTSCILSTQELAGIPHSTLGENIGSLAGHRDQIVGALDLLFSGI